jgi:uncharacterized protein YaaW (UPF0174 family)
MSSARPDTAVTIGDDEVLVTVVRHGLSSGGAFGCWHVYLLTRTGPTNIGLIVEFTVGGTATSGSDYVALVPTCSFFLARVTQ